MIVYSLFHSSVQPYEKDTFVCMCVCVCICVAMYFLNISMSQKCEKGVDIVLPLGIKNANDGH